MFRPSTFLRARLADSGAGAIGCVLTAAVLADGAFELWSLVVGGAIVLLTFAVHTSLRALVGLDPPYVRRRLRPPVFEGVRTVHVHVADERDEF